MQYQELAERLEKVGRPIPVLGLRRIESEERRVDADDLVALAIVLGVSPVTLLMPYTIDEDEPVSLTGAFVGPVTSERAWL
jgi:transcriptional regulator with XRE-family HTH domain